MRESCAGCLFNLQLFLAAKLPPRAVGIGAALLWRRRKAFPPWLLAASLLALANMASWTCTRTHLPPTSPCTLPPAAGPPPQRRARLPRPAQQEKSVSLWTLIKDMVGKDLTRVCLPVYFNEPLSALQVRCLHARWPGPGGVGSGGRGPPGDVVCAGGGASGGCSAEGPANPLRMPGGQCCGCAAQRLSRPHPIPPLRPGCTHAHSRRPPPTHTHAHPSSPHRALPLLPPLPCPPQKTAEELEYSYLLDEAAAAAPGSVDRLLRVAAFAVSAYSGTVGRTAKPFNPLLGETYEFVCPERGFRCGRGPLFFSPAATPVLAIFLWRGVQPETLPAVVLTAAEEHFVDLKATEACEGGCLLAQVLCDALPVDGTLPPPTHPPTNPSPGVRRFIAEKVVHHPTVIAARCEGRGWVFEGDADVKSKFWGRSIELHPEGGCRAEPGCWECSVRMPCAWRSGAWLGVQAGTVSASSDSAVGVDTAKPVLNPTPPQKLAHSEIFLTPARARQACCA